MATNDSKTKTAKTTKTEQPTVLDRLRELEGSRAKAADKKQLLEKAHALFGAVDLTAEALVDWLHEDQTFLGKFHDYALGARLARQLADLVPMLIEADQAAGGEGDL